MVDSQSEKGLSDVTQIVQSNGYYLSHPEEGIVLHDVTGAANRLRPGMSCLPQESNSFDS
jgi:hypothetical protein